MSIKFQKCQKFSKEFKTINSKTFEVWKVTNVPRKKHVTQPTVWPCRKAAGKNPFGIMIFSCVTVNNERNEPNHFLTVMSERWRCSSCKAVCHIYMCPMPIFSSAQEKNLLCATFVDSAKKLLSLQHCCLYLPPLIVQFLWYKAVKVRVQCLWSLWTRFL